MPDENKKLNPQITMVTIGRRDLKEIEIYPLAVGDQLAMTSIVTEGINMFVEAIGDAEVIGGAVSLILENIPTILSYVIDNPDDTNDLLKDITNEQAIEISEIVYEQNYSSLVKKVRGLLEKAKKEIQEVKELPSRRPSQPSANITDTDLSMSTEQDSKTEASQ